MMRKIRQRKCHPGVEDDMPKVCRSSKRVTS